MDNTEAASNETISEETKDTSNTESQPVAQTQSDGSDKSSETTSEQSASDSVPNSGDESTQQKNDEADVSGVDATEPAAPAEKHTQGVVETTPPVSPEEPTPPVVEVPVESVVTPPVDVTPPAPVSENSDMATPVVTDTVTKTATVTSTSTPIVTATGELTIADQTTALLAVDSSDAAPIATLKEQLRDFMTKNSVKGTTSEDYLPSAKAVVAIAKTIVTNPTREVMDLYLKFFRLQKDGATSMTNYMLGSNLLPVQQVRPASTLRAIFYCLAVQSTTKIDTGQALQILGRPEIIQYYQRRLKVFSN